MKSTTYETVQKRGGKGYNYSMINANEKMTVVVLARNAARVIRKRQVTTLDEVRAIHAELPRNDIALFVGDDPETAEMWTYYPELDGPTAFRCGRAG